MKTVVSQKAIIYKRATITNSKSNLQTLLAKVLAKTAPTAKAAQRREIVNESDQSTRLINKHVTGNQILFGQLVFFEPGKSQVLITVDGSAEFYKIDALTTDQISKAGRNDNQAEKIKREFINSILHFGIFENHVMLIQSAALKSRDFEAHINWLLGTRTTTLGKSNALLLCDTPTKETIEKLEKSPAKKIKIGTPIDSKVEQAKSAQMVESAAKSVKYVPVGMGANILAAALGENWLETAKLTDALDDANLQVTLQITYLRKTTENGQRMLDNIATALRHADEADVEIELSRGGTIKGGDLKLSGKIGVKTINGLVDEADLHHQMHLWLMDRIGDNSIDTRSMSSSGKT